VVTLTSGCSYVGTAERRCDLRHPPIC
jgi:hypothetical protein